MPELTAEAWADKLAEAVHAEREKAEVVQIAAIDEVRTIRAHLRAIIVQVEADPSWTGVAAALRGLLPGGDLDPLAVKLREKGMGHLADRLAQIEESKWTPDEGSEG